MPTVRAALADFRSRNKLDPHSSHSAQWGLKIGPVSFCLPNFDWRKRAILKHDLHHLLTGYPCTIRGECLMATWEFAAGRYPHPASTAFCLPLVSLGMCLSPKEIWLAFKSGRRGQSLYGSMPEETLLDQDFCSLQKRVLRAHNTGSRLSEVARFAVLLVCSALLIFIPLTLVSALVLPK